MKNRKLLLFFLSIIISVTGCTKSDKTKENNNSNLDKNISKKSTIKDINKTIPKDAVFSINGQYIMKKDLPKEYNELKYNGKKRFLSRYIYLKVVLDTLKDKEKLYKNEISKAKIKKEQELKKRGVVLGGLEKFIANYDTIFNTIAYQEVLKKHKDIKKEVNDFYTKHNKAYNYPNMAEIAHISLNNKKETNRILKELQDKNLTIETFAKNVEKYSKDLKTISNGGYVGKVGARELGKDNFNILWKAKENNILKVALKEKDYFHIIYIFNKYPAHKATLEEERENIINFILAKEIKKWKQTSFSKANKSSEVKVFDIKVDI